MLETSEISDGSPSDVDIGTSNPGRVVCMPNVADKFENSSILETEETSLVQHIDIDISSHTDTTEDSGSDDYDDNCTEHANESSDSEDGVEIDTFAD